MKDSSINRVAILGMALAAAVSGGRAQSVADQYAPLRSALAAKKKDAVIMIEDARFLADEYGKYLEDPETDSMEKPSLRQALIQEEARLKQLQGRVLQLQTAIQQLRSIPRDKEITVAALKDAHDGLGELGSKGQAAWEQIIRQRDAAVESLTEEYREALAYATMAYEQLQTAERANQILLTAGDLHRSESTDAEFRVSRGLPAIRTAAELGFGIAHRSDDPNLQAQTTLIALVGHSQFFWDHHARIRDGLGEERLPADKARNILGVPNGDVLASDRIVRSESNLFHLSDEAKEAFNGRIRAIWGTEGSISVSWWDHNRAKSFHQACAGACTMVDDVLVPNEGLFALLDQVDQLIDEKERAAQAIQDIHAEYEVRLAEARSFDGKEALSSAHFNALQLAKKFERTIAQFESAHQLLDKQLADCGSDDWTPDAKGIIASAQAIGVIHRRLQLAGEVKEELATLLR